MVEVRGQPATARPMSSPWRRLCRTVIEWVPLVKERECGGDNETAFLAFVLTSLAKVGVEELDQEKLMRLLRLKYHNSIADAVADLGQPEEIGQVFGGFQKFLYQ